MALVPVPGVRLDEMSFSSRRTGATSAAEESRPATVPDEGTLYDDERALEHIWMELGGLRGDWKRKKGWKYVGTWKERLEELTRTLDEERVAEYKSRKKRLPKEGFPERDLEEVCHVIPECYGMRIHKTRLVKLQLHNNELEGTLHASLGLMTHLCVLNLFQNMLEGPIPDSISHCHHLMHLDLSSNELTGPIPYGIGMCRKLVNIHLEHNELKGEIPESITKLTELTNFTAYDNKLSGEIPQGLGEGCTKLKVLSLHNNRLTGLLPESLTLCTQLRQVLVCKNRLGGGVPKQMAKECDIVQTPRTESRLPIQLYPAKEPDEDEDTEEEQENEEDEEGEGEETGEGEGTYEETGEGDLTTYTEESAYSAY